MLAERLYVFYVEFETSMSIISVVVSQIITKFNKCVG